jgi:hypothetical protein
MRFEVFTAVKISMLAFWVVTPCGLVSSADTNVSEGNSATIFSLEVHTALQPRRSILTILK